MAEKKGRAHSPSAGADKSTDLRPWAIFLLAISLRVAYVFTIDHLPLFDCPAMDTGFHDIWAREIAKGDVIGHGPFIRSPMYPYILGLLYYLSDGSYYVARLFFTVVGSLSVVMLYHLASRLFNRNVAAMAGIIAALSWTSTYFDGELLDTSTAMFMSIVAVLALVRVSESPGRLGYFLCGALFGAGALARDNFLPIIAVTTLWVVYHCRARLAQGVAHAGLYLVGAVLVIAPVTVRNAIVLKDFIPISYYTGVNLYIGNNPRSDGRTVTVPGTREDFWGGVEDVHRTAEQAMHRPLKPSEVSRFYAKQAIAFIHSDIPGFLRRSAMKFLFVFDFTEYSNNQNMYFFRNQSWLLGLPVFFSAWFYMSFGTLGIFFAVHDRNKKVIPVLVFLGAYCIPLSFFYVYSRLRQPIIGFFIVFAAYALTRLREMFLADKRHFATVLLLCLTLFALLAFNSSSVPTMEDGHFTLGNAYFRKGDLEKARDEFAKAAGLGEPYRSRISLQLGKIELQEKNCGKASDHFLRAISADIRLTAQADEFLTRILFAPAPGPIALLHPEERDSCRPLGEVFLLIGNAYALGKEYQNAELAYVKSLAIRDDARTYLNLGNVLSMTRQDGAIGCYHKAIELDAEMIYAYMNLADDLEKRGNIEEALLVLKTARERKAAARHLDAIEKKMVEVEKLLRESLPGSNTR